MSKTGVVQIWRGSHGFAEMADGTLVYIAKKDIGGGILRVGRTLAFDVEEVEGHGGRLKGVNVTGDGILGKDVRLPEEEMEQDKKLLAEARAVDAAARKQELDAAWAQVEALRPATQTALLKRLAHAQGAQLTTAQQLAEQKEKAKRDKEKARKQAERLAKEAQERAKKLKEKARKQAEHEERERREREKKEKRADPTDPSNPKKYTRAEFNSFYGKENADRVWTIAGALLEKEREKKAAAEALAKKQQEKQARREQAAAAAAAAAADADEDEGGEAAGEPKKKKKKKKKKAAADPAADPAPASE